MSEPSAVVRKTRRRRNTYHHQCGWRTIRPLRARPARMNARSTKSRPPERVAFAGEPRRAASSRCSINCSKSVSRFSIPRVQADTLTSSFSIGPSRFNRDLPNIELCGVCADRSCRVIAPCAVGNQSHSLLRLVTLRKMSAVLEPMQTRIGKPVNVTESPAGDIP